MSRKDWFEKLLAWTATHQELALGCFLGAIMMVFLMVRCEGQAEAESARHRKEFAAIRSHMEWLQRLPETEKRTWTVVSYCHPAAANNGVCTCEGTWYRSEVAWSEQLKNGDVACHVQR